MSDTPIVAYVLQSRAQHGEPALYLREAIARMRAAELGLTVTIVTEQTSAADAPLCWAVRGADGEISLHLDMTMAELYATRLHGTVHPLAAPQRAEESAPRVARPQRDPQGELTPGGLMRL